MKNDHIISNEEMETVNGGMILDSKGTPDYDPLFPYEVIENNTGKILGKFPTPQAADSFARSFGPESYNAQIVDWATVDRLRKNPNVF